MRRMISWLLMICLFVCLSPAALAAPLRDIQRADVALDGGIQTLAEMVLGAAVMRDIDGLEAGEAPGQELVEGALALGLYHLSLPYHGDEIWDNKAALSVQEAANLYQMIFTSGEYTQPAAAVFPCVTARPDGLDFDLAPLGDHPVIGAAIYSAAFDGAMVEVQCDVFTYYGEYGQSAEMLPEDALTWLCNARVLMKFAPETAFGYTVSGFSLSETYQDGMLYDWNAVENSEFEYSVNLPAILGLAADDPAHMAWQTADGLASVTIDVWPDYEKNYDQTLADFLLQNPQQTVTQERDFGQFYAVGEGAFSLWIVSEDLSWAYELKMTFPPERQAEYTLYAEFIRNSMIVWGLSNG